MNIKKVRELKRVIKNAKPEAVNMKQFFEVDNEGMKTGKIEYKASIGSSGKCGSAGCIAGWTCLAFASPEEKKLSWMKFIDLIKSENDSIDENGFFVRGMKLLGLTEKQANKLFLGEGNGWGSVKKKDWFVVKTGETSLCGIPSCSVCESMEDETYESKAEFIMNLNGEFGKKAILKQLDYMIKTGKV